MKLSKVYSNHPTYFQERIVHESFKKLIKNFLIKHDLTYESGLNHTFIVGKGVFVHKFCLLLSSKQTGSHFVNIELLSEAQNGFAEVRDLFSKLVESQIGLTIS